MKISEGIKTLEGKPAEIPDCSRDDLPEFFKEQGYKVGLELGVYKGEFTKKFLEAGLKMYGVDPWGNHLSVRHYPGYRKRQQFLYDHTCRELKPYLDSGQCTLIRRTSVEAIKDFDHETLDFIYIDADHRLRYIVEDLYEWQHKVRKGGVICGHDYFKTMIGAQNNIIHVQAAVDAHTKCFVKGNWYILGRRKRVEGEKRDKWLSWMWIKE